MRLWNQIRVLHFRNSCIRKHQWISSLFEVLIPVGIFWLLVYVNARNKIDRIESEEAVYRTFNRFTMMERSFLDFGSTMYIRYTPETTATRTLMNEMMLVLRAAIPKDETMAFNVTSAASDAGMEDFFFKSFGLGNHWTLRAPGFGIYFSNLNPNKPNELPNDIEFTIRPVSDMFRTAELFRSPDFLFGGKSGTSVYQNYGFLAINWALNEAFLRLSVRDASTLPKIFIKEFPAPASSIDRPIYNLINVIPTCCIFIIPLVLLFILKNVISEKETGAKELMKMMGLKSWMNWVGWTMAVLMTQLLVITKCVALLVIPVFGPAILQSSITLIWVFLILYLFVAISFSFLMCPIFKRPTLAICIAFILWGATAYMKITIKESSPFHFISYVSLLLPNLALVRGWETISYFEPRGGACWSDFFTKPAGSDSLPLSRVFGCFLGQCLVFSILAWYLDALRPGPYGIPKGYLFFLKKSYWVTTRTYEEMDDSSLTNNKNFELVPQNLKPGIQVRGLTKSFQKFVAVNNISVNFYEGEITALLGHNGAGKTTTMSMLTGMIPADSGKVIVDGYNTFENMEEFRQSLGLCPQHNLLFSFLTTLEHLIFFGLLKGLSREQAHSEAMHLMELQNISNKANVLPDKLSGGMKRKLSLAIALIGGPKILMLDEPTSGMDPESRREMWNLLLSIRGERTIILTTHFMEEADVLGDRIAIMDHGNIMCFGTSIMLKNLYGAGYYLNILKKRNAIVDRDLLTSAIREFVSEAKLKSDEGPKLTYVLPIEAVDSLPDMFAHLESTKDTLGIATISVACTTLEEVFLKVGEIAEGERRDAENGNANGQESNYYQIHNADGDYIQVKYPALLWQQFVALLVKKLLYSYRRRTMYIIFGLVPIIAALFANLLLLGQQRLGTSGPPKIRLNSELYKSMRVLYNAAESSPYTALMKELISPQEALKSAPYDDIDTYLLSLGNRDRTNYFYNHMMALDFNGTDILVAHNPVAVHSPPICLNLAYNLILKNAVGRTVSTLNHPISLIRRDICNVRGDAALQYVIMQIFTWFQFYGTAFLVLTGSFTAMPVLERTNNSKQLQLMTGASAALYWLTIFIVDFFYFIFITALSLLIFVAWNNLIFQESLILFLITAIAGMSGILFAYVVVYYKKTYAGAYSFYLNLGLFLGTYGSVIMYGLLQANIAINGKLINGPWLDIVDAVLRLIPQYSFIMCLVSFAVTAYQNGLCRKCDIPNCKIRDFFETPGAGNGLTYHLSSLLLAGILYLVIITLVESGILQKLYNLAFVSIVGADVEENRRADEDPDIQEERERVDSARNHPEHTSEHVLLVERLVKKFSRSSAGVRGVSFGVRAGECFGLLGVNGAGKTTTFRMLTGDTLPTAGDCSVHSVRLSRDARRYLAQIGYCPQVDGINEYLTGREHLRLFAHLRGIHRSQTDQEIKKWMSVLGLTEYSEKLVGAYSGGNKRKMSTAMSLIGDPSLVVLDEPTSGVDPISRRKLWDILIEARKRGQAIVFTSHSMDECETLCDRLTIMAAGKLMCIGNVEYLKQRYAQGYTIQLKLGSAPQLEFDAVKRAVEQAFEGAVLKDQHAGSLSYHITSPTVALSELFTKMREIKETMNIVEDYQVCNTTLEQVFLAFARSEAKIIQV
ncbi:unnamed protein product [Bemisia tabaci]|uniref:ABC transporter domain-containing protein n=1 Tax=Bemisia tabaci TaxID=7038 RepID=A0A9P0ACR5_BEMTA|nr:unnamed protein product [Bemisia tabaci]